MNSTYLHKIYWVLQSDLFDELRSLGDLMIQVTDFRILSGWLFLLNKQTLAPFQLPVPLTVWG